MEASNRRLISNIVSTVTTLFILQCVVIALLMWYRTINIKTTIWFFMILLIIHVALGTIFVLLKDHFYILDTKRELERINFTNWLTMFRISATPTIVFLLLNINRYDLVTPTIIFVTLVFITDFLDGKIARHFHQTTQIGQHIDSWSDYITLLTVSVLISYYNLISGWFFILVLIRLVIPIIGIGVLFFRTGFTEFHSSPIAKQSLFSIMIVYALSLGNFIWADTYYVRIIFVLEVIAAGAFVIPSIIVRAIFLIRTYFRRSGSGDVG